MMLIADSGSTNTQWSLLAAGDVQTFQTMGLNPYFNGPAMVEEEIGRHPEIWSYRTKIHEVFFYGSGCGSEKNKRLMTGALENTFPQASVTVDSDLLGAARGLFHQEKGVACILGTGSNSGLYNGRFIVRTTPALGYILGDEGSGNHLGRELLKAYMHQEMPESLRKKFRTQHPQAPMALLDELYNHPYPNRFLAGFTPFLSQNMNDPYIEKLLHHSFDQFLQLLKKHYPADMLQEIRITGSVGWAFRDLLEGCSSKRGIKITTIEASPMKGLAEYHKNIH
jgi:N-acetylglucosamine kinase-like BadF-type ATPase